MTYRYSFVQLDQERSLLRDGVMSLKHYWRRSGGRWTKLKRRIIEHRGAHCEKCSASGVTLEAHEVWEHISASRTGIELKEIRQVRDYCRKHPIQSTRHPRVLVRALVDIRLLCHECHRAEHLSEIMGPPDAQKYFMKLSAKIGNANGTRQRLTHGVWSYDAKNPLRLYSRSRKGVPVRSHVEPFDLAKLWKFGISVGELSLDLDASTAPKSTSDEGLGRAYMSRSLRIAATGKDPSDLGLPWPKLAKESPPPSTSEASDRKKK